MGVPRLAPWIFNNFPNSRNVLRLSSNEEYPKGIKQVDYLYIDANAILHSAAQLIFNYGEKKNLQESFMSKRLDFATKVNMVYETFWDSIIDLTQAVKPTKFLYIAIDGTAPVAKQVQQRQRRFIAARNSESSNPFNSNCISPGTEFMNNLSGFIKNKSKEFVSQNKKLIVIYSPPTDPGEGEHKIMNFIRKRMGDDQVFVKNSHCIYSPDGDLIMLCLTTYLDTIYLLRNGLEPRVYDFINMSFVQKNLCGYCYASNIISRNKYDVVNDFVLAGFFIGNDFLPKVQMFYTLEEGFQSMIDVCKIISKKNKFLTKNGKIVQPSFAEFVSIIAQNEIQHLRFQSTIVNKDPKFDDDLCRKHFLNSSNENLENAYKSYSDEYYSSKFSNAKKTEICREYLKSLLWVFIYYTQGLPSWRFYYKYAYAPLLRDFGEYLLTPDAMMILASENVFDMGIHCHPYVQLLCILPSSSKALLPNEYQDLLDDSDLNFKIDYAGKTKEHFGIALIEHANVDKIEKRFRERSKIDVKEKENPILYFWDKEVQHFDFE